MSQDQDNIKCTQWCTECGARFTAEEVKNASECPKCHTTGIPCDPANDFKLEINWHELRILTIWASNWANDKALDLHSKKSLKGIIHRLQRQNPKGSPLTMSGEIRELRQGLREQGSNAFVETNIPVDDGLVVVHGPGAVGHSKDVSD